jgi:hypothetical protein
MTTYTVTHAFGDHAAGDTVDGETFMEHDLAYLLAVGCLVPDNATPKVARRGRKVSSESEG